LAASFREICNCIGLSGNISIIKNFFGYNKIPAPFTVPSSTYVISGTLSLLQQVKLLKQDKHVRLHIKIAFEPASDVPTIDQMVNAMRLVYGQYEIGVVIKSTENLTLSDVDIEVYSGTSTQLSNELLQLFNNMNNVGTNEIVVYVVRTVYAHGDSQNGWTPPSLPGTILAGGMGGASIWTLAHEIGHKLGNCHAEDPMCTDSCPTKTNPATAPLQNCLLDRLMTCCSTDNITHPPPDLTQEEVQKMISSGFTFTC